MSAQVDIVAVETSDGVRLEGSLRRADAGASLGID